MKKIVFTVVLLSVVALTFAQTAVGTAEDIKRFFNTTTYVVLEPNPLLEYNSIIKETVKKHWTLTPVEFVTFSTDDFEKARFDTTKSFLITHKVIYEKDKTKAKYNYLYLVLGGDYEYVYQMPEIANVPMAYDGVEEETYAYKIGMLTQFVQKHVELTRDNPQLTKKNVLKYYYKNLTADVKNKTLYITKDNLAKNFKSMNEIKSIYPYKVELVEREDVLKAIDEHNDDVVFIHKVGPEGSKRKARCYNTIVGTDATLYYFSYHMISDKAPEGMLKKDWKKLAKAKEKK